MSSEVPKLQANLLPSLELENIHPMAKSVKQQTHLLVFNSDNLQILADTQTLHAFWQGPSVILGMKMHDA